MKTLALAAALLAATTTTALAEDCSVRSLGETQVHVITSTGREITFTGGVRMILNLSPDGLLTIYRPEFSEFGGLRLVECDNGREVRDALAAIQRHAR